LAYYKIKTPITAEAVERLISGDQISISGYIYSGRDLAHKRLVKLISENKDLPIDLKGQIIFYAGPTPARPGKPVGSIGPTTSYRMDAYATILYKIGVKATIGKGPRGNKVKKALKKYKAVYLATMGGAAALISKSVVSAEVIAYPELGPEAIWKLKVKNFPCIVINDTKGGDLYQEGKNKYMKNK